MTELEKIGVLLEMLTKDVQSIKKYKNAEIDPGFMDRMDRSTYTLDQLATGNREYQETVFTELTKIHQSLIDLRASDPPRGQRLYSDSSNLRNRILKSFRLLVRYALIAGLMFAAGAIYMYWYQVRPLETEMIQSYEHRDSEKDQASIKQSEASEYRNK